MLKRLICAAAVAMAMLLPALAPLALAQTSPFFQIPLIRVQGASQVKFPEVAGFANVVSIAGNTDRTQAFFWEKAATSTGIAGPRDLGTAGGQADFATASTTYGADGSLYYVWSDFDAKRINIRVRKPGQDFGPTVLVTGASGFPSDPNVGVADTPAGRIVLVVWREANGELRYRFSQTDGATWSGTGTVDLGSFPEFSVYGRNGALAVGYTRPGGSQGNLQAYVKFWNGNGFFERERISPDRAGGFAEPTIAREASGRYIAVYRGIDRNANFGTYIAARNPDGTWNNSAPFGRIDRGDIGSTWVDIDPQGNWHLFWSGTPLGRPLNVYYARRNADQTFTPVIASGGSAAGGVYNVDGALTTTDNTYAHAVYERFEGDFSRLGYSMVTSPGSLPGADAIQIEEGAAFTNKPSVRVDFVGLRNTPTQVRYRWGAAPGPGDPLVPFVSPLSVPLPAIEDVAACPALTLYTQLVNAAGAQIGANSDTVRVDRLAQASASIAATVPGPDPAFTRSTGATVTVRDEGECAGLSSAVVSGGVTQVTIPLNGQTAGSANKTLTSGDGTKTITAVVSDVLGNSREIPLTLTLDTTAPDVSDAGSVDISAGGDFSGIVDVELSGVSVSEPNLYGVQVTTRYTPAGGSAVSGTPQIIPASLSGGRLSFSYSVASGLPAGTARAGSYQLTVRLIDKAGNVAAESSSGSVTFSQAPAFPRLYLPSLWQ